MDLAESFMSVDKDKNASIVGDLISHGNAVGKIFISFFGKVQVNTLKPHYNVLRLSGSVFDLGSKCTYFEIYMRLCVSRQSFSNSRYLFLCLVLV